MDRGIEAKFVALNFKARYVPASNKSYGWVLHDAYT